MKKWLKRIGLFIGVLTLLLAVFLSYAYFIEPRQFVVVEETLAVPNWSPYLNGLRVVTIADIHTGSNYAPPERVRYVVEQTNAQNPDVIVLLGDYVSEAKWDREARNKPEGTDRTELKIPVETIAESLKGFKAKYGVFAIIGNHDWYHNEQKIHRMFEEIAGITVLQNEIAEVPVNGETLRIWGIEDLWRNRQVPAAAFDSLTEKKNLIAITHNPDSLLQSPAGISIMFSGHTHGGQLNWPFFGPKAVFNDARFMDGHTVVDGKHVYVSSGVGTSVIPFRFRVPPEINVITLNAAE
ncbi:MAG: metallophosphoesterase [Pyrinomonadaceae bacterium]|nr:metallophosphoesterase [Pyrinomonadaceae bacterium]